MDPGQSAAEPWHEDAAVTALRAGMRRLLAGLVVIYVSFVAVNLARHDPRHPLTEVSFDLTLVVFLAGALVLWRRPMRSLRAAHVLLVLTTLPVQANVLASSLVGGSADTLAYLPYVTIGIGAVIVECLALLSVNRRRAVTLYLQGHSVPEAATLLDISPKNAENLVYRGLAELRCHLKARGVEP